VGIVLGEQLLVSFCAAAIGARVAPVQYSRWPPLVSSIMCKSYCNGVVASHPIGATLFRRSVIRPLSRRFKNRAKHNPVAGLAEWQAGKGLAGLATASTTQTRSFSSASAPAWDEAGFCPVTSLPSVTTKGTQLATFS
jgi:hypothetical protein